MKLNLVVSAIFWLIFSQRLVAEPLTDTCVIWLALARNPECKIENLDSTLRGFVPQLISPNQGNVLQQFTITIFNEKNTIVEVKNNGVTILKKQIQPGLNNFEINAQPGVIKIILISNNYELSGQVNVVSSLPDLPVPNPESVIDHVKNCEFLIQAEFYEQAFQMLVNLQEKYPESYEVWATGAVLHSILGNRTLARQLAAKAISLFPEINSDDALTIMNLVR